MTDLTKLVSIPLPALEVEDAPRRTAPPSSGASASSAVGFTTGEPGFNWKCIVTGITLTEDLGGGKRKEMDEEKRD